MPLRTLDQKDRRIFEQLTEQESHTREGEIAKSELIEKIIRERYADKRHEIGNDLADATTFSEDQLEDAIDGLVQPIRISRLPIGDGREVLIVEKGDMQDTSESEQKPYTVLLYSHIDTFKSRARTKLNTSPDHPERLTGLGVYDMGAGILNQIDLICEAQVPPGECLVAVFMPAEEKNSEGTMTFHTAGDEKIKMLNPLYLFSLAFMSGGLSSG